MRPFFDYPPAINNENAIGVTNGRQPVSNNQRCSPLHQSLERILDQPLLRPCQRAISVVLGIHEAVERVASVWLFSSGPFWS